MKLKIKDEEYGLRWSLGAFAEVLLRIGDKYNMSNEIDVIRNSGNSRIWQEVIYCAMLVGKQIELDDETYQLPFSRLQFEAWVEEQPQEINEQISDDFRKYTNHGKDWETRISEEIARIQEFTKLLNEEAEPKKKVIKKKPSPKKNSNA